MFNKMKREAWEDGSQWGIDTFAWTLEMLMIRGMTLEEAYESTKKTYVNRNNLKNRLDAWRELNV